MEKMDPTLNGDRPIHALAEDRLGFGPAAQHAARAINSLASSDGFVIGIEGEWGAGKTSFINLVIEALRGFERPPEIVKFLPWIISARDVLLQELMSEVAMSAIRIDSTMPPKTFLGKLSKAVGIGSKLRNSRRKKKLAAIYGRYSGRVVKAARLAEVAGLVGAGVAATAGKEYVDSWLEQESLSKEKDLIQKQLQKLDRKIVVFIDDLDRLEAREVVELLRLVRAVVDFPNVVFVLCYSPKIISKGLELSLGLDNGMRYLEKIVQVTYAVPHPEEFALRQMFMASVEGLYPQHFNDGEDLGQRRRRRLESVVDDEGSRALLTPRHVMRAVNSLHFHASSVANAVDLVDMVWLHLIRSQSQRLHRWIGHYLMEYAAQHSGARITNDNKAADKAQLESILEEVAPHGFSDGMKYSLAEMLPGIDVGVDAQAGPGLRIQDIYVDDDPSHLIEGKRLGSPQHFRLYFALAIPQDAITDEYFASFLESLKASPENALQEFKELAQRKLPGGRDGTKLILDRLGHASSGLPLESMRGLLLVLAGGMDHVNSLKLSADFGANWAWEQGYKLFERLWGRFDSESREQLVGAMFGGGDALEWLTDIFRKETYSHGVFGGRPKPALEWLLSESEYDIAGEKLACRYRNIKPVDLENVHKLSSMLYAWMQYRPQDEDEVRAVVARLCEQDEAFLKVLDRMRGWQSSSSSGVSFPLRSRVIEDFMDLEAARTRLIDISKDDSRPGMTAMATSLLNALVDDDDR